MHRIDPRDLTLAPFRKLDQDWALLVSGRERPNPMTVSWGGFGTLWNRPVVTVYVRRIRHTFTCLEETGELTLSFLPRDRRAALDLCGKVSGRDEDKWRLAGLEPEPSETLRVPRVKGAELALEGRVLASVDLEPERLRDRSVLTLYAGDDWHRAYFAEVLAVFTAPEPAGAAAHGGASK